MCRDVPVAVSFSIPFRSTTFSQICCPCVLPSYADLQQQQGFALVILSYLSPGSDIVCLADFRQALPWSLLRFAFLGLVGLVSHKVPRAHQIDMMLPFCCPVMVHCLLSLDTYSQGLQSNVVSLCMYAHCSIIYNIIDCAGIEHKARETLGSDQACPCACCHLPAACLVQQ